jgi:dihydropteroate synthase
MGILNSTPDSFYPDSRASTVDEWLNRAEILLNDGADIIDIGGQSTRPGAELISEEQELERVIKAISSIHARFPEAIISIDTFYANVARKAIEAGASIINDISGGQIDKKMFDVVISLNVPYVLMHMRGTPSTMQQHTHYDNLVDDVLGYFVKQVGELRARGVKDIIIDPGFGFAKTIPQNFQLLRNLSAFSMLDCPIMVGLSRKGTVYKTLGTNPEASLNGTTVVNTIGLMQGASILRVHDVKEARDVIKLYTAYQGE